jgi:GNAT superfamily N-acetyltransferase
MESASSTACHGGTIQSYGPDYRHASVDIFVDPASHRRGYGSDAIRTLVRHLFRDQGHHRGDDRPGRRQRLLATRSRVSEPVVGQREDDIVNGGGPTIVVAPVSTATSRRRSKSTGPGPAVVAGWLALR